MPMISEMIQAGWALVPIPPRKKGPIHSSWNDPSKCITTLSDRHLLKGVNIGLAHAYCRPVPTCAIDIDNYRAAKPWLATHGVDLKSLLESEDTVAIWSGKKYSLKLLFQLPGATKPLMSTKINGPEGRVALEFRCATRDGKTVQDLLPPSTHPSGTLYRWMGSGNPMALPEIPTSLLNVWHTLVLKGSKVSSRKFPPDGHNPPRPESPRQIAIIQDALSHINADCSYEVWRNIVWAILSTRWACAETIAETWSRTAPLRYAENEDVFWTLVNSYMPQRENPITVGTIYHYARLGGWRG